MSELDSHSSYLNVEGGSLWYKKTGSGKDVLLTFHGFGQDHSNLTALNVLSPYYTIYHFDLPHHGQSKWNKKTPIEKHDIKELFDDFLQRHGIERFSMMAFSLGGKVLLTLLEFFHPRILKIILIAPDGIRINRWYKLATMNAPFRMLFKLLVENHSIQAKLSGALKSVGLLDRSMNRFIEVHMDTPRKRMQVYRVWTSYKKLRVPEAQIVEFINSNEISVYLYLGKHDRVIPGDQFNRFKSQIRDITFRNLPSGHNHLIEKVAEKIQADLFGVVSKNDGYHDS